MNYIQFIKDIIFPTLDILIKICIGIILAYYLHRRSYKDKIKEKVMDIYYLLLEKIDGVVQYRTALNTEFCLDIFDSILRKSDNQSSSMLEVEVYKAWKQKHIEENMNKKETQKESLLNFYQNMERIYVIVDDGKFRMKLAELRNNLDKFYLGESSLSDFINAKSRDLNLGEEFCRMLGAVTDEFLTGGEFADKADYLFIQLKLAILHNTIATKRELIDLNLSELQKFIDRY